MALLIASIDGFALSKPQISAAEWPAGMPAKTDNAHAATNTFTCCAKSKKAKKVIAAKQPS